MRRILHRPGCPGSGCSAAQQSGAGWRRVSAKHAMVAAANPLAVAAGVKVLKSGGSAIDAAVAVQAVLGLVEPQSSGLGGGAFMVYYDAKTHTVTAYDGRETAPKGARPDMFMGPDGKPLNYFTAVMSGRSTGSPGAIGMLALAYDHGHYRGPGAACSGTADRHGGERLRLSRLSAAGGLRRHPAGPGARPRRPGLFHQAGRGRGQGGRPAQEPRLCRDPASAGREGNPRLLYRKDRGRHRRPWAPGADRRER